MELAVLLKQTGHFRAARDLQIQILRNFDAVSEMEDALRAESAIQRLACLNGLGCLYMDQHKMIEAEPLLIEAYQGRVELFGADHFDVLQSLQDLATASNSLLKHQEAVSYNLKALEGLQKQLGASHPSCLDCKLLLAETMVYAGHFQEAMELYEGKKASVKR